MRHVADLRKWLLAIALVVPGLACSATVNEFLPEIDVYYKVTDELRVWMQAKETYEAGDPVTAEFGPSLDFYRKPRVRLQNITTLGLDDSAATAICSISAFRRPTACEPSLPATFRC